MKTAAKVLGIIGGALAILGGIIIIIFMLFTSSYVDQQGILDQVTEEVEENFESQNIPGLDDYQFSFPDLVKGGYGIYMGIWLTFGIIGLVGGVLGLIGGILVPKKKIIAGVLMLVGGVLTFSGCFTFILLVLGGIFALVKSRDEFPPPVVQQ